jgi:hypothetical protein
MAPVNAPFSWPNNSLSIKVSGKAAALIATKGPSPREQLCQANIDQRVGWNAGVVTNTADPFDSPEQVIIWKVVNCVNRLPHWPIITKLFGRQMSHSRESVRPVANIVEPSVALNLAQIVASRI